MESFAFLGKRNSISNEIPQFRKLHCFYWNLMNTPLHFGLVLKGEHMNKTSKAHKQSLVAGEENGVQVLGLCRFVSEEFDNNDLPKSTHLKTTRSVKLTSLLQPEFEWRKRKGQKYHPTLFKSGSVFKITS